MKTFRGKGGGLFSGRWIYKTVEPIGCDWCRRRLQKLSLLGKAISSRARVTRASDTVFLGSYWPTCRFVAPFNLPINCVVWKRGRGISSRVDMHICLCIRKRHIQVTGRRSQKALASRMSMQISTFLRWLGLAFGTPPQKHATIGYGVTRESQAENSRYLQVLCPESPSSFGEFISRLPAAA
jgi:hypothetical protein